MKTSQGFLTTTHKFGRLLLLALAALSVFHTPDTADAGSKSRKNRWLFSWETKGEIEYDSNIFHLSPSQELRMSVDHPGDQMSGRFRDMESASDLIGSTSLGFEAEGRGLWGRKLSFVAGVTYRQYVRNPRRSYPEFSFGVKQDASRRGEIKLNGSYEPSHFRKNYLVDALDLVDEVTPDERVYNEARYSDWDLALDYTHRLVKRKKGRIGLDGSILLGYAQTKYNEPFEGRNRGALWGQVGLKFDLTKHWEVDAKYQYESAESPVRKEVLILDEEDFLVDFNNDGDLVDINLWTVQSVDRSHRRHQIAVSTEYELTKNLDLTATFARISKDYLSLEQLDVAHRDREDKRFEFKVGVDYKIIKALHLLVRYKYIAQETNRAGDPGLAGEITDYKVSSFSGGLAYSF